MSSPRLSAQDAFWFRRAEALGCFASRCSARLSATRVALTLFMGSLAVIS
jgi:hypothetical protein